MMKGMGKRFVGIFIAFAMMLSPTGVFADETKAEDSAKEVNLIKTDGDVTLKNASGKKLNIGTLGEKGKKLYSGSEISTKLKSYAFLSLDKERAAKLDESSKASLSKKDKKLQLYLEEGKLFFNIDNPLEDDETLEIRTSTLITGIRGTAGYFAEGGKGNSVLCLLEGKLVVTMMTDNDQEPETISLDAGQALETTVAGDGAVSYNVKKVDEAQIPGFVCEEISTNKTLSDKLTVVGYDVESLAKDAQNRINQEQAQNEQKALEADKKLEEAVKEKEKEQTVPKFTDADSASSVENTSSRPTSSQPQAVSSNTTSSNTSSAPDTSSSVSSDTSSGSQSNSNSNTGAGTVSPPPPSPDAKDLVYDVAPTLSQLQADLNSALYKSVIIPSDIEYGVHSGSLTIPAGKTLVVNKLLIGSGATIKNNGKILANKIIVSDGAVAENSGEIMRGSDSDTELINNSGSFTMASGLITAETVNLPNRPLIKQTTNGKFLINGGHITQGSFDERAYSSTIVNEGAKENLVYNGGKIGVYATAQKAPINSNDYVYAVAGQLLFNRDTVDESNQIYSNKQRALYPVANNGNFVHHEGRNLFKFYNNGMWHLDFTASKAYVYEDPVDSLTVNNLKNVFETGGGTQYDKIVIAKDVGELQLNFTPPSNTDISGTKFSLTSSKTLIFESSFNITTSTAFDASKYVFNIAGNMQIADGAKGSIPFTVSVKDNGVFTNKGDVDISYVTLSDSAKVVNNGSMSQFEGDTSRFITINSGEFVQDGNLLMSKNPANFTVWVSSTGKFTMKKGELLRGTSSSPAQASAIVNSTVDPSRVVYEGGIISLISNGLQGVYAIEGPFTYKRAVIDENNKIQADTNAEHTGIINDISKIEHSTKTFKTERIADMWRLVFAGDK